MPWRLVCNGLWECPGGKDEINCQQRVCSGMFKCKNSSICLDEGNLCDGFPDCSLAGDESFCDAHQPNSYCPSKCSCLLFSLFCENINLTKKKENTFNNYVSIYLINIKEADWSIVFNALDNPVFLSLKHSSLVYICKQTKPFYNLQKVDFSNDEIHSLETNCFIWMSSVAFLNISQNKIHSIARFAFNSSAAIRWLDLSWNNIKELLDKTFTGLHNMEILNLTGNSLLSVHIDTFLDTYIDNIVTNNFKVCCVKVSIATICPANPLWPNSCGRLLGDVTVKVFIWLVSSLGILMNIISCIILFRKILPSGDSYSNVVICLSINDALSCIPLLTIVSSDIIFGDDYLEYEYFWRSNFFCYSSTTFSIVSNFLSVFIINFLTLTRYMVVRPCSFDTYFTVP